MAATEMARLGKAEAAKAGVVRVVTARGEGTAAQVAPSEAKPEEGEAEGRKEMAAMVAEHQRMTQPLHR